MGVESLKQLVIDYADAYSIDRSIALAQARQESGFNPLAVSRTGAGGLMQFMPGTWQDYGQGSFDNAFDPEYNLTAWGNYMQFLLNRYGWDYCKALMAYYGGPGRVDKGQILPDMSVYADTILGNAGAVSLDSNTGENPGDNGGFSIALPLLIFGAVIFAVAVSRN